MTDQDLDFDDERSDGLDDGLDDVVPPTPGAVGSPADARAAADAEAVAAAEAVVAHDVDALLAERDQFKDIALRLQADFENYRKRVATQQTDEIDRATGKIAESLLPVLDACEAAFAHQVQGVESIWSALIGALQKHGLEALDLAEQPFDPAVAEAVMHEPGEGDTPGPVVAEVLRTGYLWKGKVLRPAMVKVRG
ncbi:MAG: nucleotide exchange factor GrpE [Ilumatobacteraceae bacterium]|nr:nucleotide exchange factor GrpE [Acidimicrobiales bacterium]MCB9393612.1 nucleotide exchange factor GrpE [Acidimicrobiaceae bacterium]